MRLLFVCAIAGFLAVSALADPPPSGKRKGPMFLKKGQGGPPPADIVERFTHLSPAERKEALNKLPPERRRMMERRLEAWESTPPDQRRRLAGSYARFQEMPPEKQAEVRQLFRQFSETFAPERLTEAHLAIRRLRRAEPEQRKALLESRKFQDSFNDEERKLIERMADDLPDRDYFSYSNPRPQGPHIASVIAFSPSSAPIGTSSGLL